MLRFCKEKEKKKSAPVPHVTVASYDILPPGGDDLIRSHLFMYRDVGGISKSKIVFVNETISENGT